jgi:hypothetical protein
MSRKPKPQAPPVSKFHPLRLICPVCSAEPFEICRPTEGDGWGSWDLRLYHSERVEAYELEKVFE